MAPRTASWAELGFPGIADTRPEIEPGATLFDRLPEKERRQVLGPGKFDAYRDGRLTLADLVGEREDPRWGPVRFERSLAQASAAR